MSTRLVVDPFRAVGASPFFISHNQWPELPDPLIPLELNKPVRMFPEVDGRTIQISECRNAGFYKFEAQVAATHGINKIRQEIGSKQGVYDIEAMELVPILRDPAEIALIEAFLDSLCFADTFHETPTLVELGADGGDTRHFADYEFVRWPNFAVHFKWKDPTKLLPYIRRVNVAPGVKLMDVVQCFDRQFFGGKELLQGLKPVLTRGKNPAEWFAENYELLARLPSSLRTWGSYFTHVSVERKSDKATGAISAPTNSIIAGSGLPEALPELSYVIQRWGAKEVVGPYLKEDSLCYEYLKLLWGDSQQAKVDFVHQYLDVHRYEGLDGGGVYSWSRKELTDKGPNVTTVGSAVEFYEKNPFIAELFASENWGFLDCLTPCPLLPIRPLVEAVFSATQEGADIEGFLQRGITADLQPYLRLGDTAWFDWGVLRPKSRVISGEREEKDSQVVSSQVRASLGLGDILQITPPIDSSGVRHSSLWFNRPSSARAATYYLVVEEEVKLPRSDETVNRLRVREVRLDWSDRQCRSMAFADSSLSCSCVQHQGQEILVYQK